MIPERPLLVPDVVIRQRGDLYLLQSASTGTWCVVNELGCRLARSCTGNRSWRVLAQEVAARHGILAEQAEKDVLACLRRLNQAGLLAGAPPASKPDPPAATRPHITLQVTGACNLWCRHCYQPSGAGARETAVPLSVLRTRLVQCVAARARGVTLTGGEVLTHPAWKSLVALSAERLMTTVTTNAVLIDEAAAAHLAETGVHVQVSLDGPDAPTHDAVRGSGAFDAAMAGIQRLLRRGLGPRMTWSTCVTRHNAAHIDALLRRSLELGVARVYLLWLVPLGNAARHWSDLALAHSDWLALSRTLGEWVAAHPGQVHAAGCPAPWQASCPLETGGTAFVDLDGGIYPCALLASPEYRLGDTEVGGLAIALSSPAAARLGSLVGARAERVAACRACAWRHACRGACPGLAWAQTGDWWLTDQVCDVRREVYAQTAFRLASDRVAGLPPAQHAPGPGEPPR